MSSGLPRSPYKGLAPFADTQIDAMLFFGRERDAEIVAANVVASRLTVLYGPSGVGKSSLIAAAVARGLRALPEQPVVVVFSSWPDEPVAGLARAVADEAGVEQAETLAATVDRASTLRGDVYLLLDQVEEHFLYHPDDRALERALADVLGRVPRANVLLSLREDAVAKLDRFKASIPGILDNYLRLDRLSRAAAEAAVVEPLARFAELGGEQVEIEPALVGAVLDQVATGRIRGGLGGAGQVAGAGGEARIEAPYLQLVLERLWEVERDDGSATLRATTLDRLGGAARIVADHLERALTALPAGRQEVAARLFRQLVTPSGTKIAYSADDLVGYADAPAAEVQAVLDALAERRILRPEDDGTYEIFHDVLAEPVLAWCARQRHAKALAAAHRRSRRLALVAGLAVAGLALMVLVTVFALVQRSNARDDARAAHARELDAAALALLPTDPELGLMLARDSAVLSATPTAEDVLRLALTESRVRSVVVVGKPLFAAAVIGDATVTAADDGSVLVARAGLRKTVGTGQRILDASIDRAGNVLLTGGDGLLRLVSGSSFRLVPRVQDARGAELSADGTLAVVRFAGAAGEPSPIVRIVDVRTGAVVREVDHKAPATAAALSMGGRLLATGGVDHVVRIWKASNGTLRHTLEGHVGQISAVAFSPRGVTVASASTDGIGRVWRVSDGQVVSVLSGHTNFLLDIDYSPDGEQVVTASSDRTARTWKAETGELLATYAGSTERVTSASFAGTNLRIVTASLDGTARTWDTVVQPELPIVASLGAPVTQVAFVADGRRLSAAAGGRSYRIGLPKGPAVDVGAAPPPDRVVTGPGGMTAEIRGNTVTLTRPDGTSSKLVGHTAPVLSVSFSADGKSVVTASRDHDARTWDVRTGALLRVLRGHFALVSDARFSPDGRWVVTAGPITAGLWNAASGKLIYLLRGHAGKLLAVAFSPDGRQIATGGEDGTVRVWSCTICGDTDELVEMADDRLAATGREPTAEERQRYGL